MDATTAQGIDSKRIEANYNLARRTSSASPALAPVTRIPSLPARLFLWIVQHWTGGRGVLFPLFFEQLARFSARLEWWTFMNYGYTDEEFEAKPLTLKAEERAERYCAQLYHKVAGAVDLRGKDVLEVSSGRGGGARHVRRYLAPRSVTAIDISSSAVALCRRLHRLPGLRFIQGDAMDLPVFDESIDAVINIEASFCYVSFGRFLAEARRVLRPGGHLLFADLRLSGEIEELRAELARSGFRLVQEEEITAKVVRALKMDSARREEGIRRHVPWPLRGVIRTFAGTEGSRMPKMLGDERMRYLRFVLCKQA